MVTKIPSGEGDRFSVVNVNLTWKVRADDVAGAFCFFEQTLQLGEGVPPHHHSYAESFYVLQGELVFVGSDGLEIPCRRGDVVLAEAGTRHAFHNRGTEVVRLLSISVGAHQRFFDAVAAADRQAAFASMPPGEAMKQIASIGQTTDTHFVLPSAREPVED
jgi:mannose-6-phosphate isomerase-like protein (cupin superfamily)